MRPGTQPPSQAGALFLDNAVADTTAPRGRWWKARKAPARTGAKSTPWRRDFGVARAAYHAWRSLAVGPEKR